ncbi:MAG: type II toxin-antitoxin system VapC family toxin [Chloroflexi bacterium]|nr:type II toxin-antitoxin system VapC family toxin [Chloroflexota bacterium]
MSNASLICVVDANVALKLFFVQPLSDQADALFQHLEADSRARFHVPDFFYAECVSAFANYVRLAKYPATAAKQDIAELRGLALHVTPTADLATAAMEIALSHQVSGYDAFYVALADRVNAPLITADEKLVRATAGKHSVQALATFAVPPLP